MANDFTFDANCVALWRFEELAFTADSKGTNDLTNQGVDVDTTNFKEGACSGSYVRANSDYFVITDGNLDSGFPLKSGEANKTFSFAFWVKFTGTITDTQKLIWVNASGNVSFEVLLIDSKLTLNLSSDGDAFTDQAQHATALVADRWYHVGIAYDNSDYATRIRIWDDTAGAIHGVDATSTEDDIFIGDADFYIGHVGSTFGPDCNIDEVVVFGDVLSVGEIDAIRAGNYKSVSSLALAATLHAPTIAISKTVTPDALALAATLQTPTVALGMIISPAALALVSSLQVPTLTYDYVHSVAALDLAATLQAPTIDPSKTVSPAVLALALTLQSPTVALGMIISPAALALVASLYAPAINYDYTHTVTALALAASIQSPTLNYDFAFSVSALALAATLQTPTPCYDYKHSVSALALALTLQAPDVLMTHSALPPLMQKMLIDPYSGGAWIWLVKIEITGQATQYIARNTEDVVYYSQTYTKGNVDISGQQYTGGCSVPSVNIRIAQDGTGTLEGIINDSNGGEDGTVTLIRTHEDFFTDSIAPLEMSYDIIKAGSDSQWVNLEIGIPNPLTQRLLADMYSSTKCSEAKPSRFKGPKCQYAGANTSCTGKYSDCYTKGNHVHWCGDLGLDGNVVRV